MTVGLPTPPVEERAESRRGRGLLAFAIVGVIVAGSLVAYWQGRQVTPGGSEGNAPVAAALDDSSARAPTDVRVRVRVLNVSGVTGLARRASMALREYGYDVVDFGSGATKAGARTRVVAHTGHRDWAERVTRALGVGEVDADTDTSRFVDLTIFLGSDWKPPAETLRP